MVEELTELKFKIDEGYLPNCQMDGNENWFDLLEYSSYETVKSDLQMLIDAGGVMEDVQDYINTLDVCKS